MKSLYNELLRLQYKTISVSITSNSPNPITFSGVLFKVTPQHIQIVMQLAYESREPRRISINFNKRFASPYVTFHPGSIVEIPIDKIEAISTFTL